MSAIDPTAGPTPTTADEHLAAAGAYTNQLVIETMATQGNEAIPEAQRHDLALKADQGRALRLVIYHGFAALVQAVKELDRY